jgi:hypothetical protein
VLVCALWLSGLGISSAAWVLAAVAILAPVAAVVCVRGLASIGIAPIVGLQIFMLPSMVLTAAWFTSGDRPGPALIATLVIMTAASVAFAHAGSCRLADELSYPRWAASLQVVVFAALGIGGALWVATSLADRLPYYTVEASHARYIVIQLSELARAGYSGWPILAVGIVIGAALGLGRHSAIAAAIALYMSPGFIVAAVIGGMIRLAEGKSESTPGRSLASGTLVGAAGIILVLGVLQLTKSGALAFGVHSVGELAATGWLALPTFLIGVCIYLAASLRARARTGEVFGA